MCNKVLHLLLILVLCLAIMPISHAESQPYPVFITGNGYQTYVILSDRSLWACGKNSPYDVHDFYLGDGTRRDRRTPVRIMQDVVSVSSANGTYAIKTDGSLWGWGEDVWSETDQVMKTRPTPTKVMDNVKAVASFYWAVCAIKKDGTAWGWGKNEEGALGAATGSKVPVKLLDDVVTASIAYQTAFFLRTDGSLWGCGRKASLGIGDNSTEIIVQPIKVMENVKAISSSAQHYIVIKKDNSAWGWGYNWPGTLSDDEHEYATITEPIYLMGNVQDAIANDLSTIFLSGGNLYCRGSGYHYMKKPLMTNVKAIGKKGGLYAIDRNNALWASGGNQFGQMGTDSFNPIGESMKRMGAFPNPDAPPIVIQATVNSKRYSTYTQVNAAVSTSTDATKLHIYDALEKKTRTLRTDYIDKNNRRYWTVRFQIVKDGVHPLTFTAGTAMKNATVTQSVSVER